MLWPSMMLSNCTIQKTNHWLTTTNVFVDEKSANKLESIVKLLKIVSLSFIKLTIDYVLPLFFVDEKSGNKLESMAKWLKNIINVYFYVYYQYCGPQWYC